MASVLDRPMFQKNATEARDRLKQLGNIGSYDFGEALPVQAQPDFSQAMDVFQDTTERAAQNAVPPTSTIPKVVAPASEGKRYVIGRAVFIKKPSGIVTYENGDPIDIGQAEIIRGIIAQQDRNAGQELAQRNERALAGMYEGEFPVSGKVPPPQPLKSDMEADARGQSVRTFVDGKPLTAADLPAFKGRLENQAGPSGMEAEARKLPQGPQGAPVAPKGPSDMEADARGRKPLVSNPAEVAAGLNDPTPEVREKTAADFAKQFADMSPKYKGTDKGLMLAQIGFAIAAGDSPNAMSNIANGLSAGADMMIKDKAARDEFDRQIQLTSMQYGLGEVSKLDAEKRAMAREGRNGTHYVADRDITLGGRKYTAGQSVFLPNEVLWDKGVPAGLVTESMADSVSRNKAALEVALEKAKADKAISVGDFTKLSTELNSAADSLESTRALRPLLEASIMRAADGKVTGVNASLTKWVNDAASAVGVDLGTAYEDPAQYQSDMLNVSNQLIQEILRETGRNISVSDRKIVADMVGQINNDYDRIRSDPNILVGSLQNVLKVIDRNEQAAIDQYTTVTRNTAGLLSPSGGELTLSDRATRVFEDTAPVDMGEIFSYDEASGVWKLKAK